ncbi:unnamed protein product [Mytilus edulis]|uniref:Novel STAND NTPase 3 domain-containing protein n=1 Tax=Mytilus edulis TaxID=6550 RepID=A0A8S3QVJ8_MYTED|nr:unnamed protein product [Mytilus edulis]
MVRLCHIGIEIANAQCGSNMSLSSAESDDSSPNETQSDRNTTKTPIQSSIPIDLERRIREMEYSSHTGPPAELDNNKKRWLVVGICLHSVLAIALRKYVEPVVTNLYNSLKLTEQIDQQTYKGHLKIYGVGKFYLNYKTINNNMSPGNRAPNYDYKVQNAVDLSKLFLETSMAHYKGFDESCDSSALLGIIVSIDKFPAIVQIAAKDVRLYRNIFKFQTVEFWNVQLVTTKIEDFIYVLHLNKPEESQAIRDLNKWKTNDSCYTRKTLMEYGSSYDADIPEIERWKQNSKDFIKTDIFTVILGIIKDNPGVLLTGISGMGKTLTAQNIALQLCQKEGYSIVPCNTVKDIKKRYKDNVRHVFFVDDICGKYTANIKYIENWMRIKEFVNFILRKGQTKILATCRTEIVKQKNVKTLKSFLKLFDLTRNYSAEDKMKLARKYLKVDDEILTDIHDGFDVNEFLNSPCKTFSDEWDTLKTFDKEKFCVLLLCVIYNGTINESMFDVLYDFDKEEKRKLKVIFECCNLGRDTPRSAIKDKLNACVGTYFTKVDREYKVIHDKMFDFLCDYFGKALLAPILKYADDKLICERVQLESIEQTHCQFTIIVHSTDEQKYLDRLKMDIKNGKLHWCLNNAQMKYKEYRIMLRDIIKDLDIKLIRNLINIKDDNGINSFIISCLRGYDELVDFFITVGADVDGQIGFFTPLTAACHAGHLKTVEILLKGGSNIDGANTQGETPLYTACVGGYYSLVNFLIEKEADINKQNKYRRTPLYATCLMGHVAIVSLLINKGENVFQNKDSLIAASLGVNDTIVEKLYSNDCCVNTVDINGKTALFIACEEGYTEIVKLLIENNADIYKVDSEGKTPLHAACCVGNNDIVSMLMSKDLDLNMFDLDLETPLHKACRKGSIDVIQNLLAFGADINKTNRDVHTPAHIAKTEGSILDVRILKALEEKEIEQTEVQNLTPKKQK